MVHYAPSLLHILIIILFTWLILKLFRALFLGIQQGYVVFPGFHEEWALPTYKILRFLVLALTLVMIFPLLPGAESPVFRGISLFIGEGLPMPDSEPGTEGNQATTGTAAAAAPTRLMVILFTDIVGSVDLKKRLGDSEAARMIAPRRVVPEGGRRRYGG